jgi:hypothetical protein
MDLELGGKVAVVVTGASKGIGRRRRGYSDEALYDPA